MEMRSSLSRSIARELNGGEGVSSSGWGVAPSSREAPGPAHGEEGGVRYFSTDGVAVIEARHSGDGLPEMDKRHWRK
jgi:hypothetical protein